MDGIQYYQTSNLFSIFIPEMNFRAKYHKSLFLTFLPKNYSFRVPSLHHISSVIWTGIAAYRILCTSQVICKQNAASKILSMYLEFCITLSLAGLITTEI